MDDPCIKSIPVHQLLWYTAQIEVDEKESFELNRNLLEYLASFINPENVQKIRDSRDNTVVTDDIDSVLDMLGDGEFNIKDEETVGQDHPYTRESGTSRLDEVRVIKGGR